MPAKASETALVKACLILLAARGIFAWRNNSGALRVGPRFVRFGLVGSSDILAVLPPQGRLLAIECKRDLHSKTTPAQFQFLACIMAMGGFGMIVYSTDDLERFFQSWGV